eukprot:Skav203791  [mRNA]  locus=scaffold206:550196:557408:+ [translate_table: standard]
MVVVFVLAARPGLLANNEVGICWTQTKQLLVFISAAVNHWRVNGFSGPHSLYCIYSSSRNSWLFTIESIGLIVRLMELEGSGLRILPWLVLQHIAELSGKGYRIVSRACEELEPFVVLKSDCGCGPS